MLFIKYVSDKYGSSNDFAPPVTIPRGLPRPTRSARTLVDAIGLAIAPVVGPPRRHRPVRMALSRSSEFLGSLFQPIGRGPPFKPLPAIMVPLHFPCRDSGVDRS